MENRPGPAGARPLRRPRLARLAALAALLAGSVAGRAQDPSAPADAYVVRVEQVLVPALVLDRDRRPLRGLGRDDFRLRVDGKAAEIEFFEEGAAALSLAVIVDASASMVGSRFEAAREAASALLARLGPGDRALLLSFDHRPRLRLALTGDREALQRALEQVSTGGGTAVVDALALGVTLLGGEPGRKAAVLMTDGAHATSGTREAEVIRLARSSQVVLHAVWIGDPAEAPAAEAAWLAELAQDLGGRLLVPGSRDELLQGPAAALAELRSQYTLGFTPVHHDGRWHRIEIEVRGAGLAVKARRGFLAAPGPG